MLRRKVAGPRRQLPERGALVRAGTLSRARPALLAASLGPRRAASGACARTPRPARAPRAANHDGGAAAAPASAQSAAAKNVHRNPYYRDCEKSALCQVKIWFFGEFRDCVERRARHRRSERREQREQREQPGRGHTRITPSGATTPISTSPDELSWQTAARDAMRSGPSGRQQRIPLVVRGAVNPIGAVRVSPRQCPRESAARLFPLFPFFCQRLARARHQAMTPAGSVPKFPEEPKISTPGLNETRSPSTVQMPRIGCPLEPGSALDEPGFWGGPSVCHRTRPEVVPKDHRPGPLSSATVLEEERSNASGTSEASASPVVLDACRRRAAPSLAQADAPEPDKAVETYFLIHILLWRSSSTVRARVSRPPVGTRRAGNDERRL